MSHVAGRGATLSELQRPAHARTLRNKSLAVRLGVGLVIACLGWGVQAEQAVGPLAPDIPAVDAPASGAPTLSAAEGRALADKSRCLGCHQVDRQIVGPPFRAVARRFHGQPQAAQYLAQVIRRGSNGQWGAIPMPAQEQVPPQDALHLAQWILSLDAR